MPIVQGIRTVWGIPVVRQTVTKIAINLIIEQSAPAAKQALEAGVPKAKDYGREAYKKIVKRYKEPGKSFVVDEKTDDSNGHRIVSVSREYDEEFLQTRYPS